METKPLGFGARLVMAFVLPFQVLLDGLFAARIQALAEAPAALPEPAPEPIPEPTPEPEPDYTAALQLLAILQREGRFVDFLQEPVADFEDADIGAAARVVHAGCNKALQTYLDLAPVRTEEEGAPITLAVGYDASRNTVTGNVAGEPPYSGHLAHHGWQVTRVELPTITDGHDPRVIAPAEVEL